MDKSPFSLVADPADFFLGIDFHCGDWGHKEKIMNPTYAHSDFS